MMAKWKFSEQEKYKQKVKKELERQSLERREMHPSQQVQKEGLVRTEYTHYLAAHVFLWTLYP